MIPDQMKGADFLFYYGIHIDQVTMVDPMRTYSLRRCARHPVMENYRINTFMAGIQSYEGAVDQSGLTTALGELMIGSHRGYESIGLGEPVTSRIVELVREQGKGHGMPGARISGGGSGGTVAVMVTSNEGLDLLMEIKEQIEKETEKELKLFEGSSDGAHYIN
jgi:L-arabinokinase